MLSRLHIKAFWRKKIFDCVDFKCFCCIQAILTHKKNKNSTDLNAFVLTNVYRRKWIRAHSKIIFLHVVHVQLVNCVFYTFGLPEVTHCRWLWIFLYLFIEPGVSIIQSCKMNFPKWCQWKAMFRQAVITYRHSVTEEIMPSWCCNITNDQGGWRVFKVVPEWICSLLVCVYVRPCRTKAQ